jgi:hypothetical protein
MAANIAFLRTTLSAVSMSAATAAAASLLASEFAFAVTLALGLFASKVASEGALTPDVATVEPFTAYPAINATVEAAAVPTGCKLPGL